MARDYVKSANTLVEKSTRSFIGSVDDEGYPNLKVMLSPREHIGIKEFFFTTNTNSMRLNNIRKILKPVSTSSMADFTGQ